MQVKRIYRCDCGALVRIKYKHLHKCITLERARKMVERQYGKDYKLRRAEQLEYIARSAEQGE